MRSEGPVTGAISKRLELPVLFESVHEMAVIKPAGMATELTTDPKGTSLISRVRAAAPNDAIPKLPHRLDRVTRGIVVVALSEEGIRFHNEQLRQGAWEKIYLARLDVSRLGEPESMIGEHKVHLRTRDGRSEVVRSGGRRAITEVLAVARTRDREDEGHALLRLHTGRYHQIRATMAHLGVPLVGDWLYGAAPRQNEARFYLEHTALRFTPCGADERVGVHLREDPDRESIAPGLRAEIDRILAGWEVANGPKR